MTIEQKDINQIMKQKVLEKIEQTFDEISYSLLEDKQEIAQDGEHDGARGYQNLPKGEQDSNMYAVKIPDELSHSKAIEYSAPSHISAKDHSEDMKVAESVEYDSPNYKTEHDRMGHVTLTNKHTKKSVYFHGDDATQHRREMNRFKTNKMSQDKIDNHLSNYDHVMKEDISPTWNGEDEVDPDNRFLNLARDKGEPSAIKRRDCKMADPMSKSEPLNYPVDQPKIKSTFESSDLKKSLQGQIKDALAMLKDARDRGDIGLTDELENNIAELRRKRDSQNESILKEGEQIKVHDPENKLRMNLHNKTGEITASSGLFGNQTHTVKMDNGVNHTFHKSWLKPVTEDITNFIKAADQEEFDKHLKSSGVKEEHENNNTSWRTPQHKYGPGGTLSQNEDPKKIKVGDVVKIDEPSYEHHGKKAIVHNVSSDASGNKFATLHGKEHEQAGHKNHFALHTLVKEDAQVNEEFPANGETLPFMQNQYRRGKADKIKLDKTLLRHHMRMSANLKNAETAEKPHEKDWYNTHVNHDKAAIEKHMKWREKNLKEEDVISEALSKINDTGYKQSKDSGEVSTVDWVHPETGHQVVMYSLAGENDLHRVFHDLSNNTVHFSHNGKISQQLPAHKEILKSVGKENLIKESVTSDMVDHKVGDRVKISNEHPNKNMRGKSGTINNVIVPHQDYQVDVDGSSARHMEVIGHQHLMKESETHYHSIFVKNKDDKDGEWNHHFDADNNSDAADEARSQRNSGYKVKTIRVPKDQADWRKPEHLAAVRKRLNEEELDEHITKEGNIWVLRSKKTGKNLGHFDSLAAAKKHEQEIEYFKHESEELNPTLDMDQG